MARIRKHRSKYQVLYRDPSTGKEKSAGVYIKWERARQERRELELQLETGDWVDPASRKTPYGEWAETWLSTRSHLKAKTLEGYQSLLNSRILPEFREMQLGTIRTFHIEQWVSSMTAEGLSPSRIRQAHQVLSATLTAAVRSQLLSRNPAEGIAVPRKVQREMLVATPTEVDAIAHVVPDRYGHAGLCARLLRAPNRRGNRTSAPSGQSPAG